MRATPAIKLLSILAMLVLESSVTSATDSRAHTSEVFEFTVAAPISAAFPLFGADRERLWAPGWQPVFIWPQPQADRLGMVFTVAQGDSHAIWVNTEFDPVAGRIQYVYVLPKVMTTVITLQLREQEAGTLVRVRYERTSLTPSADLRVRELAQHDALAGPEWSRQIADYLARQE